MKNLDFSDISVLVAGDLMLDEYFYGECNRISPEAPVPILKYEKNEIKMGGAANVALGTRILGLKTTVIGITGSDQDSKILTQSFNNNDINALIFEVKNSVTIKKIRFCSNNHQMLRLDYEDGFKKFDHSKLIDSFRQNINKQSVVILSDYNKGTLIESQALIKICNKNKVPVIIDPKGRDFNKYTGAYLLKPNLSEFELIVGKCESEEDILIKGNNLRKKLKLSNLLITRGSKGMTLFEGNKKPFNVPAIMSDVTDVTGAGDTVISVLSACISVNMPLKNAVNIANQAAGISVSKFGTAPITPSDIDQLIK
jgi:D-beta-D-heptose 7-phosphate kinase/D-beta-D-heptose 1-phosphate adenosyltransferase